MKRGAAVVLVLSGAVAAYVYWASDERQIRRLLDGVAGAVSQHEGEGGVAGLAEVAGLSRYLATDVVFEPGTPYRPITGAQDIVSTAGRIRAVMATVELTFTDVQIAVDGKTASVHAMARLALRDRNGDERLDIRDAVMALEQRDTGWVITTARAQSP